MKNLRLSTLVQLAAAGALVAGLTACGSSDDGAGKAAGQGTGQGASESPGQAATSLEARPELEFRQVAASTGAPGACAAGTGGLGRPAPFAARNIVRAAPTTPGAAPQPTAAQCADLSAAECDPADEDSGTSVSAGDGWTIACVEQSGSPYSYLLAPAEFTSAVIDAEATRPEQQLGWVIELTLPDDGAREFADVTRALAGTERQLAIVLDGDVLTAPVIQSAITDGKVQISGDFSENSAKDLADRLVGDD